MANLITAYYTKNNITNGNKFLPGDVIVREKKSNYCLFGENSYVLLYIVDLKKEINYVTYMSEESNRFHVSDEILKSLLGRHWEKYKIRYFNLGLPIEFKL